MALPPTKSRGFKVTDSSRSKLVGVACCSLKELIENGTRKLNLKEPVTIALQDGTIVDDNHYFQTIPAQTLFILYRKHERIMSGVDVILQALESINASYLRVGSEAGQLLLDKAHELSALVASIPADKKTLGNTKNSDPDWFSGLETNAKTKEDFMRRRAQDRVRGYLYRFQDEVKKSSIYIGKETSRHILLDCLTYFKTQLNKDNYFGCYFDRRCAPKDQTDSTSVAKKPKIEEAWIRENKESICDSIGSFHCEGEWKSNYCEFGPTHSINPYCNRESRVIFSTWNLDHRIEKSRTILPTILNAVDQITKDLSLNVEYFYKLLFTRYNLRLVHIVCHDKTSHDLTCDRQLLYIPIK